MCDALWMINVPPNLRPVLAAQREYYDRSDRPTTGGLSPPVIADVAEIERVRAALRTYATGADVLDLGCGAGDWTATYARMARRITALDWSSRRLAECRRRLVGIPAEFRQADVFSWTPSRTYDLVVLTFMFSHVPAALVPDFLRLLRKCLNPNGRVFILDHRAAGYQLGFARDGEVETRVLDSRSAYQVVKVLYEVDDLANCLRAAGWTAQLQPAHGTYLFGAAWPADQAHYPGGQPTVERTR
jgi:demethylmenaquinone methyltransferase/2-methoxy-6-polyprenyl-1,4-benzoquinol methylase